MASFTDSMPRNRDHHAAAPKHTVLIVERVTDQTVSAQRILENSGHWLLDVAETVEAALSLMATRKYCAVLADAQFADGGAYQLIDWAKGRCPVVIMTDGHMDTGGHEALHRGAYDWIARDALFRELLPHVLQRALQRHGDRREIEKLRADIQAHSRRLSKAKDQLRSLDSLRSEVLNQTSDEIQQPLNIIRQVMSLMSDGVAGGVTSVQQGYLKSVLKNCDLLELLIGDVFQLQGLETGNHPVRRYRVRARTLIDTTVKRIIESSSLEGRRVAVRQIEDDVFILCDSELLAQGIQNLMEAALAFTPRGGQITVAASVSEHTLTLEITSDGPAMTQAERRKVFDRFGSVANRPSHTRPRTGLELAIARTIVERHDGQLSLRSKPRRGNTFYATVPLWDGHRQLCAFLQDRMQADVSGTDRLAFSLVAPADLPDVGDTEAIRARNLLLHRIADLLIAQFTLKPDNLITIVPQNVVAVLTSAGEAGGLSFLHRMKDHVAQFRELGTSLYCSTVMVTADLAAEDWISIARNRAVLINPRSGEQSMTTQISHNRCKLNQVPESTGLLDPEVV
jgi:signal transduction histidine kinase